MKPAATGPNSPLKNDRVVLDTGILIRFLRGTSQALDLFKKLDSAKAELNVSVISALELYLGCRKGTDDRPAVDELLDKFIVLEVTLPVAAESAVLIKNYPNYFGKGIARGTADALILASAWDKKAILYTLNTRHFSQAKIPEVNIHSIDQNAPIWA